MENILMIVFIAGLSIAAFMDLQTRKISNVMVCCLTLNALLFQFIHQGWQGLLFSVLGFVLGIALLYVPFSVGAMGGGDVKLLAAIGAMSGPKLLIWAFLISAVLGGLFSVFEIIRKKSWGTTMRSMKERILYIVYARRLPDETQLKFTQNTFYIPYGICLALGGAGVLLFGGG